MCDLGSRQPGHLLGPCSSTLLCLRPRQSWHLGVVPLCPSGLSPFFPMLAFLAFVAPAAFLVFFLTLVESILQECFRKATWEASFVFLGFQTMCGYYLFSVLIKDWTFGYRHLNIEIRLEIISLHDFEDISCLFFQWLWQRYLRPFCFLILSVRPLVLFQKFIESSLSLVSFCSMSQIRVCSYLLH